TGLGDANHSRSEHKTLSSQAEIQKGTRNKQSDSRKNFATNQINSGQREIHLSERPKFITFSSCYEFTGKQTAQCPFPCAERKGSSLSLLRYAGTQVVLPISFTSFGVANKPFSTSLLLAYLH
ncbi:hypothetical protein Chor_011302, partial [Crotalus horridus]